jgi:hypothetical protein
MGHKYLSQQLYEKCREVICPILEDIEHNLDMASCFYYLALYLLSLGEITRVQYFKENAEHCCRNHIMHSDSMVRKQAVAIQHGLQIIDHTMDDSFDIHEYLMYILRFMQIFFDGHTKSGESMRQPNEFVSVEAYIDYIVYEYAEYKGVVPTYDIEAKKALHILISTGSKLNRLRLANQIDQPICLQYANIITEQIQLGLVDEGTPLCAMAVAEASLVHAYYFNNNRASYELNQLLRWDFRGLKTLADRHWIVKLRFTDLICILESLTNQVVENS